MSSSRMSVLQTKHNAKNPSPMKTDQRGLFIFHYLIASAGGGGGGAVIGIALPKANRKHI